MSAPDVIVGWLQNDFGRLGRPAEAVARSLVRTGAARRVAYVEPFVPAEGEPTLQRDIVDGVEVFRGTGSPPAGTHEIAGAVTQLSGLENPVLLNFGVAEANWWLQYEFGPVTAASVLVTYDKLADWAALGHRRGALERTRTLLIDAADAVCGLSLGSIDDVPGATYVGHGCDDVWHCAGIDDVAEPADLSAIPHPRAVYVGALSTRFDHEAVVALGRAGISVVIIGIAPQPRLIEIVEMEPNVHFLGRRAPEETPPYLLHCDVGIIPHTDEPFTRSMEPHKAYNYAAAGLPTVTLHTEHAPALGELIDARETPEEFVTATLAAARGGRLGEDQVGHARTLSWDRVAGQLLDVAVRGVAA